MLAFFRKHVSVRLATIWLVVAIPLSALFFVTYGALYSAQLSLVEEDRRGDAEAVATSFQLFDLQTRFALRSAGVVVADAGPSFARAQPQLQSLSKRHPVAYVAFADTRGRVLAASRQGLVGSSVATDVAFRAAMRAPDGGGIESSHVSSGGVVGFHVAQAIPVRPGRVGGVMLALVDVRRLRDSFPVMVQSGGISLIDSAGQVVFQNENPGFAARRERWGAKFAFIRRALGGHVAVTRSFAFPGGGTRIAVFVPVRPAGWAAGSSVAPGEALAPFYRTLAIGAPIALAIFALALLTSIGISRGIRRSLGRLTDDARRIGSGRLEEPVRADRDDEIGEVARSLEAARIELLEARRRTERSFEEQAERARLSDALTAIDHSIHSTMSAEEMLSRVLPEAAAALGSDSAAMGYRERDGWRVRYEYRLPPGLLGRRLTDDQLMTAALAARMQQVVVVEDALTDLRVNPETVREFQARSFIVGPLVALDEVVGAVYFIHHRRFHTFTPDEVEFVRRLTRSLGLALTNARIYESEHDIAQTLQTALLALPERIPGVEFAHLYHSATEAARVGGDFYDLFELEHHHLGITIGDISGHGVDAAVLTSLVKNAIRVQATQQDKTPDKVMACANGILYDNSAVEIFATVFFGVLDLDRRVLEYCNAGHPAGACLGGERGVRKLPANSPLIGAFAEQRFALSSERVGADDLLFLYTDGLTEARRDGELFGEERLFGLLAEERGGHPEETLRRVVDEVLSFAGGRLSDDMAVLAVRRERGAIGSEREDVSS